VVPVVCKATFEPNVESASSGQLREICNNAAGYLVIVDHDEQLGGSTISVDGQRMSLGPSGSTVIVQRTRPGIAAREVRLVSPKTSGATLSFRVQPL
jgi:hypothetical protein